MIASSPLRRDSLLFVYGTLRPCTGSPMAQWLARHARYAGRARVRGRLYDLGAYPALVGPRRRGEWVVGDLYTVHMRRAVFLRLDRYEGACGQRRRFERVTRRVEAFRRGRTRVAWVYLYRSSLRGRPSIAHGDYERAFHGTRARCAGR